MAGGWAVPGRALVVGAAALALVVGAATPALPDDHLDDGVDSVLNPQYRDCAYNDTPPAHHMDSGDYCEGQLNAGESDLYTFDATAYDEIQLEVSGHHCVFADVYHSPGTGETSSFPSSRTNLRTRMQGEHSMVAPATDRYYIQPYHEVDWSGDCPGDNGGYGFEPYYYGLRLRVIPNDRPTIGSHDAPAAVRPFEPFTVTIDATDPDADLAGVGVTVAGTTTWTAVSGGAASGPIAVSIDRPRTIQLLAQDVHGARHTVSHFVDVIQDDCGQQGDATLWATDFPVACAGYLSAAASDTTDSYTFSVPEGGERLAVHLDTTQGDLGAGFTLTSPDGTVHTGSDGRLITASAPGEWRADVTHTKGAGSYLLTVDPIGSPAAPEASLYFHPPESAHQGELVYMAVIGEDPNGLRLRYTIDWGDGSPVETFPAQGFTAEPYHVFTHHYMGRVIEPVVVGTATNEEGLTTTASRSYRLDLHDDCASGGDAGPTGVALTDGSCAGDLGYLLPSWSNDDEDTFELLVPAGQTATVVYDPAPGLSARLSATPFWCCDDRSVSAVPTVGSNRLTLVLPGGVRWRLRLERQNGTGTYTLSTSLTPPG